MKFIGAVFNIAIDGINQPVTNLFCDNCGAQLTPGSLFCDECGTPVAGAKNSCTWVYENEYRVVFYDKERKQLIGGERLKVKICKVYLGHCIESQKEKAIRKICVANNIDVSKIKFANNGYAIRIH